jgi:hypothetical protein
MSNNGQGPHSPIVLQQAARQELAQSPEYMAAVESMVETAKTLGAPEQQVRNFLARGYAPTPQQWIYHSAARIADRPDGPIHIAMGGARGGAKSQAIMSQIGLDDCQRYEGLDVLYLRLIQKAGRKALDQLRGKTLMSLKHNYNRNEGLIHFPNGSQIVVGHFKNEGDIDKYIGIEYDIIAIEERTQLSKVKIDQLLGSLRTGKPGWRPRTYNATNPGGIGHQEFREQFIIPWREGTQVDTFYIPMDWRHNPFINEEYKRYLMSLTGILGEMWRDGNWDIGSGTFFIHWDEKVHVIKPPGRIPLEWPMWISMDWGWTHPCSVQWHTQRPDGTVITVAEYKNVRKLPAEIATEIKQMTNKFEGRKTSELITMTAGTDIFANTGSHPGGKTIAEQFQELGLTFARANTDRINGAAELTRRLGNPKDGIVTSWFVASNCDELIATMPNMLIDEKRPEDVLKINANEFGQGGDDSYDAARYGLMVKPLSVRSGGWAQRY